MANRRLVTVVGATGAQGGAVVRTLLGTGKYMVNIRYRLLLHMNNVVFLISWLAGSLNFSRGRITNPSRRL